jgi:hypothetical protein
VDAGIGQGLDGEHISFAHLVTPETATTCASVAASSPVADFDSPIGQPGEATPRGGQPETQLVPYVAKATCTDIIVCGDDHSEAEPMAIADEPQAEPMAIADEPQADDPIGGGMVDSFLSDFTAFEAEARAAAASQGLLNRVAPAQPEAAPQGPSELVQQALEAVKAAPRPAKQAAPRPVASAGWAIAVLVAGAVCLTAAGAAAVASSPALWGGRADPESAPPSDAPIAPLEAQVEDTLMPWAMPSAADYQAFRSTAERRLISQIPLTGLGMRLQSAQEAQAAAEFDDSVQAYAWVSLASAPPLNSRFSRMCLTVQGSDAETEGAFVTGCLQGEAVFIAQGIARRLSVSQAMANHGWE